MTASNTGVTVTTGSTVYIDAAPVGGTNLSFTNKYALWINSGTTLLADTTLTTSVTTGALVISGGVGIAKNMTIGGTAVSAPSWTTSGIQHN